VTSLWPHGKRFLHKLILFSLALAVSASCKSAPVNTESVAEQVQSQPVDNSGKRLTGTYAMKVTGDEYSKGTGRDVAILTFDESGGFRREKRVAEVAEATEEGGYVIGTRGELALFIEKVGGELLEASRPERYSIIEQTASRLMLQAGSGASFILEKRE
jgi:hypothetical protein